MEEIGVEETGDAEHGAEEFIYEECRAGEPKEENFRVQELIIEEFR